jgi:hypothetical protein
VEAGGWVWAVHLRFNDAGVEMLPCPTREVAERRASWWMGWRQDVTASVAVRDGAGWRDVEEVAA